MLTQSRFQARGVSIAKNVPHSCASKGARLGGRKSLTIRAAAKPITNEKYDYIIVGGGTAGCVLGNRLSADASKKVLILEAGVGNSSFEVSIPAGLTRLFRHPILDWGLSTLEQATLGPRAIYLARGKLLGGSSATNATLYHRGTAADYDSWNLEGWKSTDVLPCFLEAENYAQGPRPYHGVGGSMSVEQPRYESKLHDVFFASAAAAGLPENTDFNNWDHPQVGYGEFQVTQQNGERADMYKMYLKPVMGRENLTVVTQARTTRVNIEAGAAAKAAKGVEFTTEGPGGARQIAELAAGGEVIMCAGAVHTPQILMLSGVGDAKMLLEHNITPLVDLPGVGANLQDHPAIIVSGCMKPQYDEMSVTNEFYDKNNNIKISAILQYLFTKTGPMATTGCDHGAFLSTTGTTQADLQLRFVPAASLSPDGISAYVIFGELKKRGENWPAGASLQLLAVRAESKGSVGISSKDPFAAPAMDINYFSEPKDLKTLVEGVRKAREIFAASAMKEYVAGEQYPGPDVVSDADLEAYVRKSVHSGNALVGTCKMGVSPSDGSVVSSSDLKVFGVEGLRVVDASVIPKIPGGQTGAASVMIAERAAKAILSKVGVCAVRA